MMRALSFVALPLFALWLAATLFGGVAGSAALARDDNEYFDRIERESRQRAIENSRIEQTREKWRQRARERDVIRNRRVPAVRSATPPTDRLSGKLHPQIEPLGNVTPRFENSLDVQRRRVAPPRNRIQPRSLDAFERRHGR